MAQHNYIDICTYHSKNYALHIIKMSCLKFPSRHTLLWLTFCLTQFFYMKSKVTTLKRVRGPLQEQNWKWRDIAYKGMKGCIIWKNLSVLRKGQRHMWRGREATWSTLLVWTYLEVNHTQCGWCSVAHFLSIQANLLLVDQGRLWCISM